MKKQRRVQLNRFMRPKRLLRRVACIWCMGATYVDLLRLDCHANLDAYRKIFDTVIEFRIGLCR